MFKNSFKIFFIIVIILILASSVISRFFPNSENSNKSYVARQKFSGIIEKTDIDSTENNQQIIVINGEANYIKTEFANKLNIGDSVSKIRYELNATIYKKDGKVIKFDLLNNKVIK